MSESMLKKEIHCISCDKSCLAFSGKSVCSLYCEYLPFAVWPEVNIYFKSGVTEKFLLKYKNYLLSGFVFVDFSFVNLRYFVDPGWVDLLIRTKMHIVLIVDKKMHSLANYWLVNRPEIRGVIYSSDPDEVVDYKIKKLFRGEYANRKVGETLNRTEYSLLSHFISGRGLKEIVELEHLKPKEIYVRKLRLENKLGCRTNAILSQISAA